MAPEPLRAITEDAAGSPSATDPSPWAAQAEAIAAKATQAEAGVTEAGVTETAEAISAKAVAAATTRSTTAFQGAVEPDDPNREIATLPPIEPDQVAAYPLSLTTGRPQRPRLVAVASGLYWLAAVVAGAAYAPLWWTAKSVTGLPAAARLFGWTNPDPVSVLTVALVVVTALLTVVVVAACGTLAYNIWNGRRWTRLGGLVALVVTGLTFPLHPYALAAVVPAAVGAILVWLPPVRLFDTAMAPLPRPTTPIPVDRRPVVYGPQPLIGDPL